MGTFPAYALLEIFSFYISGERRHGWQTLVHVCRRWRYVALGSPRRLRLYLYCRPSTDQISLQRTLDIWHPLPLVLDIASYPGLASRASGIITALRHTDRIVGIILANIPPCMQKKTIAAMQEPLPKLMHLRMWSSGSSSMEPLPASFLGGSAPQLQSLSLSRVPYLELPKLLSSAHDIVNISVIMPDSGYISSEDMAACLSSMKRLTKLTLNFEPRSEREPHSVTQRSSQKERTVLQSLTHFHFGGAAKYLDDLVARIDAPRLSRVVVSFFKPIVSTDLSQFSQFIGQTDHFKLSNKADIVISEPTGYDVNLSIRVDETCTAHFDLRIPRTAWEGTPAILAQVCVNRTGSSRSSSLPISTVEHLTIRWYRDGQPTWGNRWLEFLRVFAAVKNLHLCGDVAQHILPVLNDATGEGTTKVLPALQNLFLLEYHPPPICVQEAVIQEFTTVRRLAGRPVAVRVEKMW